LAPHHEYLWSESESPAESHRTAEDDFVHVEWNMIMAPVTTERIAAPIFLPLRPAAEVIGEWREDYLFMSPTKPQVRCDVGRPILACSRLADSLGCSTAIRRVPDMARRYSPSPEDWRSADRN